MPTNDPAAGFRERFDDIFVDNKIMGVASGLGSDDERKQIYVKLIERGYAKESGFDTLMKSMREIRSDTDKLLIYRMLTEQQNISDQHWIALLQSASRLASDRDKASLFIEIAGKIHKTDTLKKAYQEAARSIQNDADYGVALRAME